MSTAEKTLARLRNNPRDWRIEDVITVAEKYDVDIRSKGGSHHVFSRSGIERIVSVPAYRPIKPTYIRQFIELIDAVEEVKL